MAGRGPFFGVGVALVTLFDEQGRLDAEATASFACTLVRSGVQAVVAAGTTGEAAALDPEERVELLTTLKRRLPETTPLLAGTGAPSARQAVRLTRDAVDAGADALLVLSPWGSSDPRAYYEEVAKVSGGLPLLGYHYPAASPPGIPAHMLSQLPISGCKDSSGDAERFVSTLSEWDGALYTGSASLTYLAGALGSQGTILALANVEPEKCVAAFGGDASAQLSLSAANRRASSSFPRTLKEMVSERFGTSAVARLG